MSGGDVGSPGHWRSYNTQIVHEDVQELHGGIRSFGTKGLQSQTGARIEVEKGRAGECGT
jgi:hypothetical protein